MREDVKGSSSRFSGCKIGLLGTTYGGDDDVVNMYSVKTPLYISEMKLIIIVHLNVSFLESSS